MWKESQKISKQKKERERIREHHNLYVQGDTLLLAGVSKKIWKNLS